MIVKPFNWNGHRWNEIVKEDNPSMFGTGYDIVIKRPPPISELRRYGQAVTGMNAKSVEIIKKYPRLEKELKNFHNLA